MNVHDRLDELSELVHDARAMPMSASCIVNRGQVLDLIEDIREALPDELRDADKLLAERERVVAEAREEADVLLVQAREDAAEAASQEEVYRIAVVEAEAVRRQAEDDAARMRREVDDYVDGKLASFEIALTKTITAVQRGRDKIRDRAALDDDPVEA